jgi:pimeloyl-ACP methyl ester carboxylesterase
VIWGGEDRLAEPAHAPAFAGAVPHADVHVLERCGHYPQMELPSRVNQLLADALRSPRPMRTLRKRGDRPVRRQLRRVA